MLKSGPDHRAHDPRHRGDDAIRTFLGDQLTADGYTVYATADHDRALGLCSTHGSPTRRSSTSTAARTQLRGPLCAAAHA